MMELILMVGIQGSGKTTLAKNEFPSHVHISLDKMKESAGDRSRLLARYREEVRDQDPNLSNNRRAEYILVCDALREGKNIVIDDTNITREIRKTHIDLAHKYGVTVNAIFFQNHPKAQEQNARRPEPISKNIVDGFLWDLEPPHKDEGIDSIRIVY